MREQLPTWQGQDQWKVMRSGAMRCASSTRCRTSSMRSTSTLALMGPWNTCGPQHSPHVLSGQGPVFLLLVIFLVTGMRLTCHANHG